MGVALADSNSVVPRSFARVNDPGSPTTFMAAFEQ